MNILQIDCSPRLNGHSRALSAAIVARLCDHVVDAHIVYRDLAATPVPPVDAAYATSLARDVGDAAAPSFGSTALSEMLIRELEAADVLVIGTPVNNFTVPSTLKAWIDHIVRLNRTMALGATGKIGLLADRPVFLPIAAGGFFCGPDARQPEHITPYLAAVLGCIGLETVYPLPLQGTAFRNAAEIASDMRAQVASIGADFFSTAGLTS